MKELNFVVPNGKKFNLSEELFLLDMSDVQKIVLIGSAINKLMFAMQALVHIEINTDLRLIKPYKLVRDLLSNGLNFRHKLIMGIHPQRNSLLTRVDFMFDESGELKIAEIDPMNKHGLGFALLCRYENNHGERQKIITLFSEILSGYKELVVVISRKDDFFRKEQEYFAQKLREYSNINVVVLDEKEEEIILAKIADQEVCFLDCPVSGSDILNLKLLELFENNPKRFLMPPKHWMGNKSILSFLHEPALLEILRAFLDSKDIDLLQKHIPPTFITKPEFGRYVVKKVMSSGAKGVFFNGNAPSKNVIYQEYVPQKKFLLEGSEQYVRLAAHFVASRLGELTVTSSLEIPVHGGSQSINFHVGLK